jgi:cell division transport system ATP-binding protein
VTDEYQVQSQDGSRLPSPPDLVSISGRTSHDASSARTQNEAEISASRIVDELLAPAAPIAIPVPTEGSAAAQPQAPTAAQPAAEKPASKPLPSPAKTPPAPSGAKDATDTTVRQTPGSVPVILFDGITKVYPAQPNKPALSNVSLRIYAGEFIFLVGHSGSGKSTFIRLINREILATKGRLSVAGEDVIRMRNWRVPYLRRNIGCVFQDFKLLPNKTAFENVAFALEVIGKSKHIIRTQVPEVLRLVGLEDKVDQYPDQLSGGEQQRVSIARAIVNRPPLLICDEPTGNLDPQTSLGIMRLLDRINRTGTTILVATHDREMVDSLRKRVVALENGYLVRDQDKGVYGLDA